MKLRSPQKTIAQLVKFLTVPFIFATASQLTAALKFDEEIVSHEATFEETQFTAEFKFTNEGEETETVGNVRSSCGCTVPELDKKVYEPGESGVIRATFTYGARHGMNQKNITVKTDQAEYVVTLRVNIPEVYKISPRILVWNKKVTEELDLIKTASVNFLDVTPTKVELGEESYEGFEVAAEWHADEKRFEISATPAVPAEGEIESRVTRVNIQAEFESGASESIPLLLRIY